MLTWAFFLWPFMLAAGSSAAAQEPGSAQGVVRLSAEQLLDASAEALRRGERRTAEAILAALQADRDLKVRNEARFRLAQLALAENDSRRAAILLRTILDEQPDAQRVRLELARVLGAMGDVAGARRELRQVRAGPLPPEVARVVDRFSAALREYKRFGGQLEVAIAPDSNINRATASDTLGTVLGEFELDEDAQAQSGLGIATRGSGYARLPISETVGIIGQGSLDANLYGKGQFNDIAVKLSVGPEWQLRHGRLRVLTAHQRRWFDSELFSDTTSVALDWERPLSQTAQLRATLEMSKTSVKPNPAQDMRIYFLSTSIEKALSPRSGVGISVAGSRHVAREPSYSAWSGQVSSFAWYEIDRITLIGSATFSRYSADARLALYLRRRDDHSARLMIGATMRRYSLYGFAPQLRLVWEGNASSVGVYDYSKLRGELGIVRAF